MFPTDGFSAYAPLGPLREGFQLKHSPLRARHS